MVAEVDLQPVDPATRHEWVDRDARFPQCLDVVARQVVAADAVVQHAHRDAGRRALGERPCQLPSDGVVVDHEELHEHEVFGRGNRVEDRRERGLAIHQQPQPLTVAERRVQHPGDRGKPAAGGVGRGRGRSGANGRLPASMQLDVAREMAASEEQVRDQRHVRQQHEPEDPGHRAGRGARAHQRVQRRGDPGEMQRQRGNGEQARRHVIHVRG